jgi:hypothetical protein
MFTHPMSMPSTFSCHHLLSHLSTYPSTPALIILSLLFHLNHTHVWCKLPSLTHLAQLVMFAHCCVVVGLWNIMRHSCSSHGGIGDSPWLFICEETWWLLPNVLTTTLKVHNNNSHDDLWPCCEFLWWVSWKHGHVIVEELCKCNSWPFQGLIP